jgi:hypothetical protein
MTHKTTIAALAGLLLLSGGLSGCRESEQERVLLLEPGVYQGKQDQGLTEEQKEELRFRQQNQGAL